MKCYNHNHIEAVATCSCGKALCAECVDRYNMPICDTCAQETITTINNKKKSYYIKCYILMAVCFAWGLSSGSLINALLFSCIPWGWSALDKITPNIFLFMSWMGWVVYFIVKLALSAMIGMFMAPFQIYKSIQVFKGK